MAIDDRTETQNHEEHPLYNYIESYNPRKRNYHGMFTVAFLQDCNPQQMRHMIGYLDEMLQIFCIAPIQTVITECTATSELLTKDGISIYNVILTRYNPRQEGTIMQSSLSSKEFFRDSEVLKVLHAYYYCTQIPVLAPVA